MEDFSGWLTDLKLRASWGINGNDLIDNEAFYAKYLMSLNRGSYNMNGDQRGHRCRFPQKPSRPLR